MVDLEPSLNVSGVVIVPSLRSHVLHTILLERIYNEY